MRTFRRAESHRMVNEGLPNEVGSKANRAVVRSRVATIGGGCAQLWHGLQADWPAASRHPASLS